jgi:hypothetical protein
MAIPNKLIVSSAGSSQFNGIWTRATDVLNKPAWRKDDDNALIINATTASGGTLIQWGMGIAPLNFQNGSGLWYFTSPVITSAGENSEWPNANFTWSNAFGVPGQLPLPIISIYTIVETISPQQRFKIYLRKQLKLGGRKSKLR